MGFFSWDCLGCKHSIRSSSSVNQTSEWMKYLVVQSSSNKTTTGEYDGYGRIESQDDDIDGKAVYHRACFKILGRPKYGGPSRSARDQGYFVGDYDPEEPKTVEDIVKMSAVYDVMES